MVTLGTQEVQVVTVQYPEMTQLGGPSERSEGGRGGSLRVSHSLTTSKAIKIFIYILLENGPGKGNFISQNFR
jgi:hypothetical protein